MEVLERHSSRELRTLLIKKADPLFNQLGFNQSFEGYMKEYKDGVYGYISIKGFSCGMANTLYVVMHIGMSQRDVYCLLSQLMEIKKHKKPVCLAWQGISDIVPDGRYLDYRWEIKTLQDIEDVMQKILQNTKITILPYFEENCCKQKFEHNFISRGFAHKALQDKVIPIIYYLAGEKWKGEEYIRVRLNDRTDEAYIDPVDKTYLDNYFKLP